MLRSVRARPEFTGEPPTDDRAGSAGGTAPALRGGAALTGTAPALRGGAALSGTAPALRGGAALTGTAPALRGGAALSGTAPALRGGAALRRPTALVFASGLLVGGALGALSWSVLTAVPRPRELAPASAIAKVSGRDTGDEAARAADSAVDRAPPTKLAPPDGRGTAPALRGASSAPRPANVALPAANTTREVAPAQQARSVSEIARSALGFTAFIRGGHVYGAGVLLDRAGHVLTCRHVIEGLDAITVSFSDGAAFAATLVDSDEALDIALLKIDSDRISELRPASIADVQLGDDVLAIGAPRKMAFSLSRGMVSFVGRPFERIYYLQTDLAMNGGSSGGPVMNARGDVIALSSFVLRDSEGLAFALPIDYAYRRFAAHLQAPVGFGGSAGDAFESWVTALERSERRASSKHD